MPSRTDKTPPWRLQVSAFCVLALVLGNLAPITGAGISVYRRSIAPALGIYCAYAQATGGESCSAFAKRTLATRGFFRGLPDCVHRFQACSHKGTYP
jgi:putative component of membrane protein insertase Oxa1/YidC/SpoIIIJ protein YidD